MNCDRLADRKLLLIAIMHIKRNTPLPLDLASRLIERGIIVEELEQKYS